MTKKIYSQEEYSLKANCFIAIVMAVALLPLVAIAAPGNEPSPQELSHSINRSTTSTNNDSVTTISNKAETLNSSTESGAVENSDDMNKVYPDSNENVTSDSNGLATTSDNNSITTQPSNTNSVTSPLDNINELQRTKEAKPGTAVESPLAASTKKASWYNLNYLLGGGLLLLILGGALLLFLKISKLQDEIEELVEKRKSLKEDLIESAKEIKQLEKDKSDLKAELKEQKNIHNQSSSNNIIDDDLFVLQDAQLPELVIEDLNAADRQQLAVSIDKWFATNRGQTKLTDLLPVEIQNKIKQFQWCIELWGQGYGIDSVELVESTKDAAVVSLTKPNKQGFAYCHKKPTSLSSVWENRAWYEVQRTSSTLEVVGEPLEKN